MAQTMIDERGRNIQLVSKTYSDDGPNPTILESSTTIKAIERSYEQHQIDGTNIMSGDKIFIFVSSTVPTTRDEIIDGSKTYSIVNVIEKKPGDVSILYKIQVRA